MLNEKYQGGKASLIHNIIYGIIPDGWEEEACIRCNKTIIGSIVDPSKKLRITISDNSIPLTHSSCRV
jgi:hypothetical protein